MGKHFKPNDGFANTFHLDVCFASIVAQKAFHAQTYSQV